MNKTDLLFKQLTSLYHQIKWSIERENHIIGKYEIYTVNVFIVDNKYVCSMSFLNNQTSTESTNIKEAMSLLVRDVFNKMNDAKNYIKILVKLL